MEKKGIIQNKKQQKRKKIIAYISIGEAEDYRFYWNKYAGYLDSENPEWKGNYKVRYWDTVWQKTILSYIAEIIDQGFDGIYLDIVDAYQYYEYDKKSKNWIKNRLNPQTGNSFSKDMIMWISRISEFCRSKREDFIIIPQNGSELLLYPEYTKLINGIGIEDLFTNGSKNRIRIIQRKYIKTCIL